MTDHSIDMIAALLGGGGSLHGIMDAFTMMEWAQDEIEAAQARHGETDQGPIYRSFPMLALPPDGGFELEPVYRAHCQELLDRVAGHEDLVPATDAEIIIALKSVSLIAPLNSATVTLYFRVMARRLPDIWRQAGGDLIEQQQVIGGEHPQLSLEAYESVHGKQADDIEQWARMTVQATDRGGYDPHTVPAPEPDPDVKADDE